MKIPEIWYFVCWVFGFNSLNTLVEESHEIVYGKGSNTEPLNYLACSMLSWIYPNQTEIDLKEFRDDLYEHFNSSTIDNWLRNGDGSGLFEEAVLKRTKSGGYLIFNGMACLISNNEKEFLLIDMFLPYQSVLFTIIKSTFDFVKMFVSHDGIEQLTVLKKPPPYSDCDQSNSRFFA